MTTFDTKSYCIEHQIPCFTLMLNATKKCNASWKHITPFNFTKELRSGENGFAIVTGFTHVVVDFDLKHSPPQGIYDILNEGCTCVEKTPGGYHFWFLSDERTASLTNGTDVKWDNQSILGLDIRAKGGIVYTAPTVYIDCGEARQYQWLKGDLSTVTNMSTTILEHLLFSIPLDTKTEHTKDNKVPFEQTEEIAFILKGLSQQRADNYDSWLRVGMALKHCGESCEMWDEWSKISNKYKAGACKDKWKSFVQKDKPLTKASLYAWLKEDNNELFLALQGTKNHLQNSLSIATNGSIADVFYELNPHQYLFSSTEGWFILQPNHTWLCTGSTDVLSISNILNTIRDDCKKIVVEILLKSNKTEEDGSLHKRMGETLKKISTASFLKGVTAFFSGLYGQRDVIFNEKRNLFAFTNGVIDMNTMTFRPIEPEDYISVTCGYDYIPQTSCDDKEMVHGFLEKIFPVPLVLEYVLGALSRTFFGSNSEQWFHVFTGMGANGKSVLMELCKMVFGDYYQTFSVSYLTKESDGKDRPLPEFAAARYARMLVTSEPDERDKFQVNMIKNITGNEEVTFRGMYAKSVTKYVPQFKLWILTNDMPRLSKYDQAIERRMRCVHFPTRFVYNPRADNEALRDDSLSQKFREDDGWRHGLLELLLDAYSTAPLRMPREVQEFTEGYMLENNPVGAWLRQHYDITGRRDDVVQKTDFYQAFLTDTGMHKTQKAFADDIIKCNVGEKIIKGVKYFFGVFRKGE